MNAAQSDALTLVGIYESIAEQLATARTRALMGDRDEAVSLFNAAAGDFKRFQDVLRNFPGYSALEHAFALTMEALFPTVVKAAAKPRRKSR